MSEEVGSILQSRKYYQRNKMLNAIRTNGDVSRADVKSLTAYSMTTVLGTVQELLDDGLIMEEECSDLRRGRRPTWLRINPEGGYFVGLEFNRNNMCCVVLNFRCVRVYQDIRRIPDKCRSRDKILEMVKDMLHRAIDSLREKASRVIGIGLGVPGYIDAQRGLVLSYNHLRDWTDVPLRSIVEEEFHLPVFMENNVDVMIYAYKWLLYNGSCEDMLFVSIRTGTRVVPVINNQPVKSPYGYAGEVGHVRVHGGSRLCECGRIGCLNSEITDVAIINKIADGLRIGRFRKIGEAIGEDVNRIGMQHFVNSVLAQDADALQLLDQTAQFLGEVLSCMVNIFAPLRIEIYGELAGIQEPFLERLRAQIEKDSIRENFSRLSVQASPYGLDLGAMGAAALVMQESFPYVEEAL